MKTEEELDQITRNLMKDSLEQPSKELSGNIMQLIFKEKQKTAPIHVSQSPTALVFIIGFCVYVLLIIGALFLFNQYGSGLTSIAINKSYVFMIFVLASAGSFFFFFTQLDNWLTLKRKHHTA